jgi:hypothetical protein
MGHYVTDVICSKCAVGRYNYFESGSPSSFSYTDWYACDHCGFDPDDARWNEETTEKEEWIYEI